MYDTAKRVALVKQRVRENTRRRQWRGIWAERSVYAAVRGDDAGGGRYRVLHTIEKKQ